MSLPSSLSPEHPREVSQKDNKVNSQESRSWGSSALSVAHKIGHHIKNHVGVGIICSVAYFDPGNWSVDLQAGAQFGYRPMLFVILLAGLGAMVLQSLAYKLGCVTGFDLASHCRLLLHDCPKHRRLIRYLVLYPLYVLCEIAIISTDLAELLGSAIGICLIFPTIPLWAAVLLTASDVLIFLVIGDPSRGQGRPVRLFEFTVIALVLGVVACFVVLLVRVKPSWPDVFLGFVPSKTLFQSEPDALYTAVGILGATVMPHALFLGSFLATQNRVAGPPEELPYPVHAIEGNNMGIWARLRGFFSSLFSVSRAERIAASREYRNKYGRENNELGFIQAHLPHGLVDVISSLICVAVPINSAILIIAATVFFSDENAANAGLFDAHDLIKDHIGKVAAFLFALALLCAGQTASITATLAGQIVSEGFIEWRISPFLRRIVTRSIGLIPSMVVAIAVGRNGIDALLVASQVALSIVLPFVAFPLIYLTSSKSMMRVRKPQSPAVPQASPVEISEKEKEAITEHVADADEGTWYPGRTAVEIEDIPSSVDISAPQEEDRQPANEEVLPHDETEKGEFIDYSSGWFITSLVSLIFFIVLAANVYVIVMLALGKN
ncbi:hypothetical protein NLI96_g1397 [Meripilus lineatus]|uniref:Natural resistance-associated macrophage protein n=1 Tax=Meripilus lineatus TaxID=2056292 RepID=A0AAD5VAH9_9APHY|nr:hypothetical protein NLI96_g1397 [Physisporinus lineatus]